MSLRFLACIVVLIVPVLCRADAVEFVDAQAAPWDPLLNPSFAFNDVGASGPTVFTAADGLNFAAGSELQVEYVQGLATPDVTLGPSGYADANGYCCNDAGVFNFPSYYLGGTVQLSAVVGVFANGSGQIVGSPFYVGDGPVDLTVPAGASQLQLGINDNFYSDNANSPQAGPIEMDVSNIASVPEPAPWCLLLGMGMLAGAAFRRRKAYL